jgi:hypothetical protein
MKKDIYLEQGNYTPQSKLQNFLYPPYFVKIKT